MSSLFVQHQKIPLWYSTNFKLNGCEADVAVNNKDIVENII